MDDNRITYFAETDARNKKVKFGLKAKDRTRHVYVIGKTGMGKSTMLENMAVQDIMNGEGMAFIDPHGKTADLLLEYVPKERIRDVIYMAPFDTDYPISFNVLEDVGQEKRHLVVSGLMSTFKKIWEDAWSARMEYILTNTLLALLECPGSTLLGVNRMLSDKEYRKEVVSHIQDPSVKTFWVKEFANYTERMAAEAVPAIQNKVGQFTANPLIRNMIGQPQSSFDIRQAMDNKKIMIINLSKGRIGDENMKLLGGLIVTKIYLAAMSRADVSDQVVRTLPNFYLYVDEFQNFANASFADILSEARKYKLNLTIAHQYIEQMDEKVAAAVFGNVGTMITFRVGATDAEFLEKEFSPQFMLEDLVNLGFTQIYLKLMIDGLTSSPFSAVTLPPIPHPDHSYVTEIIAASREQFSRPRAKVEEEIIKFHNPEPVKRPLASSSATSGSISNTPVSAAHSAPSSISNVVPVTSSAVLPRTSDRQTLPSQTFPNQPQPIQQSAPATHKPFEKAFAQSPVPRPDFNRAESKQPPSISQSSIKPDLQPANASPVKPAPKPVSLSSLSVNKPKIDPKVAVPERVADLKNALAAALKKGPVANNINPTVSQTVSKTTTTSTTTQTSEPNQTSQTSQTVQTHQVSQTSHVTQTKEVPEEVLNEILR